MGYVLPRLPKDADDETKALFLRHAIAALAASGNPFTSRKRYGAMRAELDELARHEREGKMLTATLYTDSAGEHRWRITAENGNNVGNSGEGYKNRADARAELDRILFGEAQAWPDGTVSRTDVQIVEE